MKYPLLISVALISMIMTSCTMEKRVYMSGYHITRKSATMADKETVKERFAEKAIVTESRENSAANYTDLTASVVKSPSLAANTITKVVNRGASIPGVSDFKNEVSKEYSTGSLKKYALAKKPRKSAMAHNKGLKMAIAALILIALGLILYRSLVGIGLAFLIVFGIAGLVLLIMGAIETLTK